ncbi:intestinal mucin-like protein [Ictalurus furcatus]|uniref:intestinal mucin-like protein n=1 Tax=Ictalurus furcatus TaxID=66913 RepID=UPI002350AC29|nr:intestinal mucin-like protein [Ictalurus furcatus]
MKCQDAPLPVCVNNHLPKKVTDESGCCSKYECECICSGFGDPHYITFDGTYYPFQGNCSYVLVKEINPKYHFSVIIDNVYCDSEDGLSCPKSLTVHYKSFKIFMTQDISNGMVINLIKVNNNRVLLPYENEDFRITDNGIESLVVIPAIDAQVTFTGMMFFINLPWQKFHGNTEGQCGTCNNNRTEDCRLPNGTIISSCEKMAPYWHVSNNNSVCLPPNPKPTPVPCTNAPICEILSTTFKECHEFVPYQYYEEACNYDVCHMNTQSIGCSSLQMYAEQCAIAGICIDWRPATNGVCEFFCEEPKVYKACGPQIPLTCDLRFNLKFINTPSAFSPLESMFWEGCYCPEGMMQLSPDINMCVNSSCDYCLMNDGQLKKAKETWVSGCDSCTCDEKTLTVSCMKLPCPTQKPVKCDALEGQVKVQQIVDCCQYDICVCNYSLCPDEKQTCPLGFTPHFEKKGCCQSHTCVPESVCVFNDTVYQPGASVPMEKCQECVCTHKVDSQTELNKVSCTPVTCNTQCPLGYEYELVPGDCCGQCVQFSCVVTSGNTSQMLKPGETWTPPNDKCVTYSCVKSGTHYYPVTIQRVCQPFFEADCVPGTIVTVDCCPTCVLKNRACNLTRNSTYLESNGCRTAKPVELTACEGSCVTSSLYSMAANTFEHSCSCCQEVSTSKKEAEFICPGGTKVTQTYVYVEKCGCYERECTLKEIPPSKQRRRRR